MKKLSLIILLILCCIGVFTGLYFGMEKIARFQNNLNLYNVTQCLDLNNNLPLTTAINLCALNLRSVGITGDITQIGYPEFYSYDLIIRTIETCIGTAQ